MDEKQAMTPEERKAQRAAEENLEILMLMKGAGCVMMLMGVLIAWRGITKMIPITGIVHGGLFTGGGVVIFIVGLLFLLLPGRKEKKAAKKAAAEAAAQKKDGE